MIDPIMQLTFDALNDKFGTTLTLEEASILLKVSKRKLKEKANDMGLVYVKVGRDMLFATSEICHFLHKPQTKKRPFTGAKIDYTKYR